MYPQYPYNYQNMMPPYPYQPIMYQRPSLLQSMHYSLNKVSIASTLKTAQKTLYTMNQIIPIVNQLRPVLHNASTALRVVRAVKHFDFDEIDDEIDHNVTDDKQTFENML